MDSHNASPMSDDLSALAWVHEEVRKSLELAHKALHRILKDAVTTGFSDMDALDPAVLRAARQHIHQGVGALELAGLPAGAMLLRASEALVQRYVARPQSVNEEGVKAIESASFALLDLMRRRLAGKSVSVMALFPQYEALTNLVGHELARPSDLWVHEWPAVSLEVPMAPPAGALARAVDNEAVSDFEMALLRLLRSGQHGDAVPLVQLCGELAADATARQAHRESATWMLACGFMQALADQRLPLTLHVKRVLSALLSQLRVLSRGQGMPSDRLAHELLFFCAQAAAGDAAVPEQSSVLDRLRQAFKLQAHQPIDLTRPSLGRVDPAWIAQAGKRVAAAKDGWSAVAAGEMLRLGGLGEQFALVADSLTRLYPDGDQLAKALVTVADDTVRSGQAPSATLAMEVATSLLYVEASLDEAEFDHPQERDRIHRMAERINAVRSGESAQPLEPWMEALYRKVSDRNTIGSVVQELRTTLAVCEKSIDQFFREHDTTQHLRDTPTQLQSIKGVMAVLGLDAAAQAVARMRSDVDALLAPGVDLDEAAEAGVHDRLASNLGAIGFLVDLLSVQPNLAKTLFVFNEDTGILAPIMGRRSAVADVDVDPIEMMARPAEQVERVRTQEVAETLVESVARDEVDMATLSDELESLANTPMVQDQPELAANVAIAQAAMERAAGSEDGAVQSQARDDVVAALTQFVQAVAEPAPVFEVAPTEPMPLSNMEPLLPGKAAAAEPTGFEQDDEMRGIFVEEAQEVLGDARDSLGVLAQHPSDLGALTTLRRAFHTLKGSSRMVGLGEFGEAAWAFEQLYNGWLASQEPASEPLIGLTGEALTHLAAWVDDVVAKRDGARSAQPLVLAADALREHGQRVSLVDVAVHADVPYLDHITLDLAEDGPDEGRSGEPAPPPFSDTNASEFFDTHPSGFSDSRPPDFVDTHPSQPGELTELDLAFDEELLEPVNLSLPPVEADAETDKVLAETEASVPASDIELLDLTEHEFAAEVPPVDAGWPQAPEPVVPAVEDAPASDDEQFKVIGPLRISIPLFNIYLNEADEQSRRLSVLLSEWALECHRPVGDEVAALAHSLAGNSGAVGYADLSGLARLLEHALSKSQLLGSGDADTAQLFNDAADDIRRLLHQFAAGFLKSPAPELLERLNDFEAQASARLEARSLGLEPPRGHLRLVHPLTEDAPEDELLAQAEPDVAEVVEPELIEQVELPVVEDLPVDLAPEPGPTWVSESDETPLPELPPAEEAPTLESPASAYAPLGLPELRPLAPLADLPRASGAPARPEIDLGEDADLDAQDAIDADLFPIFEEEALELLPQLSSDLRQWLSHPDDRDHAVACMRSLHTFKGGARLAGAMRLGELAHRMESAIEQLAARQFLQSQDLEGLEARSDVILEVFEALRGQDFSTTLEQPALAPVDVPALPPVELPIPSEPVAPVVAAEPTTALPEQVPSTELAPVDWAALSGRFRRSTAVAVADANVGGAASVRVKPRLLDRLVNHAGEVSIARTRLSAQMHQMQGSVLDLTDNLERLRQQLRDIELQAETQLTTRLEAARASQQEFDPLEFDRYTRFQELTRMMAESVNDVATVQRGLIRNLETAEDQLAAQSRLTRDMQEDLLRTRMVEFDGLSDRLYRVVRQAAKEMGKQVRLDIVGGHTEVDRGVLDRMTGAFEHLLRNCVTHGIEAPDLRAAVGKEPMGAIIVAVRQEGNEVSLEFRDDGAGLDLARIEAKARAMGLILPGSTPSDEELSQLIFTSGFSTAESVTELAGRGIGMDVVRSDVNAMGGRIETATSAGQGTSFKLMLPLTTAVTKVVMVRCGDLVASIPTNLVELVRRVRIDEMQQAYASGSASFGGAFVPFFWLGGLVQHSPRGVLEGRTVPLVIVRSAQQRVALHVDEVLGNQDVVVKNLGSQLSRVPGLAGMTLLASGAISLIYNPVALATFYGAQAQEWAQQAASSSPKIAALPDKPAAPLVLVVDDSLTVRRVTQRLLTREGYRVTLAKDGLEALERLAEETPMIVLSDIEMPRMDGFDLVRNIRMDARWRDIPIVMITSRIAQKHRDYAMELGVNHYLGKPYSEDELLSLVISYTRQTAERDAVGA
jgi:chemosensory pili system protein ChpA (sensor histidine kinase/response regulator)